MSKYVDSVMAGLKARNANEPEFLQAAEELNAVKSMQRGPMHPD